tara:strand:- start:322 stop:453 length:132 start_codon:yes stop_codon:yes gene_type:complete
MDSTPAFCWLSHSQKVAAKMAAFIVEQRYLWVKIAFFNLILLS